jgi:ABC-type arginine/histidine transport system permease subunit
LTASVVIGFVFGTGCDRSAGEKRARALAHFSYMFFFRGTPLIAQLFLIYYGSGGCAAVAAVACGTAIP